MAHKAANVSKQVRKIAFGWKTKSLIEGTKMIFVTRLMVVVVVVLTICAKNSYLLSSNHHWHNTVIIR